MNPQQLAQFAQYIAQVFLCTESNQKKPEADRVCIDQFAEKAYDVPTIRSVAQELGMQNVVKEAVMDAKAYFVECNINIDIAVTTFAELRKHFEAIDPQAAAHFQVLDELEA